MTLEIITPEKEIVKGEVNAVTFPGTSGEFEILNQHASIISTLTTGKIKVTMPDKKTEKFNINGGVIEMQENKIIVLAN